MPYWIPTLALGVLSSLIAAILTIALAGLLSKAARWTLTSLLGRLLDIDIEFVFTGPRDAASDIQRELMRSAEVRILTGRGSELQRETFAVFFRFFSGATGRSFKILLPELVPAPGQVDWVQRREEEIKAFDPAYGQGLLRSQITTTIKFLDAFKSEKIEVRLYNLPLLGRILLMDSCAYLTPYKTLAHSRESRVIKYRRGGDMYDFLDRLFNETWASSRVVSSPMHTAEHSTVSHEVRHQ